MCGITVWFDLRRRKEKKSCKDGDSDSCQTKLYGKLDRSVESMRHRGPNAKGVWISPDESAGLAHVRLSTRDLSSAGDQPLHSSNETDEIHIVVNGELYYDPSLREDLGKEYNFQSTSDSEMVIALYRRYGAGFVEHLRGEFSLALYDGKAQTLVAARDRFGVKPLHYGVFDDQLMIATQAKGVVELVDENQPLQWDARCLAQGGGHYGNRTLFKGIRKFPPGHVLVVRQGQTEQLDFKPYYRSRFPANEGHSDIRPATELIEDLRARLLEAVHLRLDLTDVPVGILLSGGVDSSAVAGMAAHLSRKRIAADSEAPSLPRCFTIAFPDEDDLDESAVARRTAEHLGLQIEQVTVTEQILANELEEACWLGEVLLWDLQHVAKKALSRHISSCGLKVVLNGDGSDELFGGYSFFTASRLVSDDRLCAKSWQQASSEQREQARKDYVEHTAWYGMEHMDDPSENKAARALGLPLEFCKLAVSRHDDWLVEEVREKDDPYQAIRECFSPEEIEELTSYHPLHRAMLVWEKTLLPNMIIAAISDGAEMAHGVESRPPFLDHIVAELSHTLPVDMLVHLDGDQPPVEKWIFREAVKPYITDEVYGRRKQAFAAPFRWKMGGSLYTKLSSLITRENIERLGFVDWSKCEDIVDRSFKDKDEILFRKAIWLAQLVSIGLQFGVQTWMSDAGEANRQVNGSVNGQVNGSR